MSDDDRMDRPATELEDDDPLEQVTPGGSVVYEYDDPILCGPAERDPVLAVEVERHVAAHVGPVDEVFHEPYADVVEVEVLRVAPSEELPFNVLVTCGMAQRPMQVPDGFAGWSHSELVLTLPPDWPFEESMLEDDAGWPIRLLRDLARFPHLYGSWLGLDHTIPNGEPAEPYASDSFFCGCILEMPVHLPEGFFHLGLSDGRQLHFLHVCPLYSDEMDYKLAIGAEALLERFDELDLTMVLDPDRPSVVNPYLPGAVGPPRRLLTGKPPWWRLWN